MEKLDTPAAQKFVVSVGGALLHSQTHIPFQQMLAECVREHCRVAKHRLRMRKSAEFEEHDTEFIIRC